MRVALGQREDLITAAACTALDEAVEHGATWVTQLGTPGTSARDREQWRGHAATIALYRQRYDIHGPAPLGVSEKAPSPQQAGELRAVQAAYSQLNARQPAFARRVERTTEPRAPRHGL